MNKKKLPHRGLFITLEGGEGVGKTTNMDFIETYLRENNILFESTREPGGTPFAEEVREVLLYPRDEPVSGLAELLLMFAGRAQHIHHKIIPCLESGKWVICDRFTDATYAYQGGGRKINQGVIAQLEILVQQHFRPDCVLLLDVPVEVGMARAQKRGLLDRFEEEHAEFFQRVRETYLVRAKLKPDKYRVIDASMPLDDVQDQIKAVLNELLGEWRKVNNVD